MCATDKAKTALKKIKTLQLDALTTIRKTLPLLEQLVSIVDVLSSQEESVDKEPLERLQEAKISGLYSHALYLLQGLREAVKEPRPVPYKDSNWFMVTLSQLEVKRQRKELTWLYDVMCIEGVVMTKKLIRGKVFYCIDQTVLSSTIRDTNTPTKDDNVLRGD